MPQTFKLDTSPKVAGGLCVEWNECIFTWQTQTPYACDTTELLHSPPAYFHWFRIRWTLPSPIPLAPVSRAPCTCTDNRYTSKVPDPFFPFPFPCVSTSPNFQPGGWGGPQGGVSADQPSLRSHTSLESTESTRRVMAITAAPLIGDR